MAEVEQSSVKVVEVYIYGLSDPRTGETRYVGLTRDIKRRERQYRYRAHTKHLDNWMRNLEKFGCSARLTVLAECVEGEAGAEEKKWIAHFRTKGSQLLNFTDGGEAAIRQAPEVIEKIRVKRLATLAARGGFGPMSAEHRIKISKALKGKMNNPNAGSRMAAINRARAGIPLSAEHRAKVSASLIGRKMPREAVEKTAAACRLMWKDPVFKAKMRLASVKGGLAVAGGKNGMCVLDPQKVLEVRERHKAGESTASIARFFDVGETSIRNILQGRTWKTRSTISESG